MRVLHLLPDLAVGGGQQLISWLVEADATTTRHDVWAMADGPVRRRLEAAGARVRVAPAGGRRVVLSDLVEAARAADVMHAHSIPDRFFGQLASARTSVPLVFTFHGLTPPPLSRRDARGAPIDYAKRLLNTPRVLFRGRFQLAATTAVSRAALELNAAELRLDPDAIRLIRPGVPPAEPARTDGSSLRRELDLSWPTLITVGTLADAKGQHLIPQIAASLRADWPELRWLIVGDGPDAARVAEQIDRHDVVRHVRLLGRREDIADVVAVADLAVSTSFSESFGLAVLEAVRAEVPVVGFDVGGFHDFLTVGNGVDLVAEPFTGHRLEAPLRRALGTGPEGLAASGRRAAAGASIRSIAEFAEDLDEVYRSVVRSPND